MIRRPESGTAIHVLLHQGTDVMLLTLRLTALACLLLAAVCPPLNAQQVEQATHVQPQAASVPIQTAPVQTAPIQFAQQPSAVGDKVVQQVAMQLDLKTSIVQSGQIAQQQDTTMKRGQERKVEVLEVVDGRVRRAYVTFEHSRQQLPTGEGEGQEETQAVEGKTYELTRDGEQLRIRYPDGSTPPLEEFEVVFGSMQSFGLPNPLAEFLLGHSFQIGQTLEMPREIAERMLGFGNELGEVSKFELTLQEVKEHGGGMCAVFAADILVGGGAGSPVSLEVTGPVLVRLDTCRTVLADFTGPMSMNSVEQTSQGNFQHQATGTVRVAVRSQYGS